VKDDKGREIVHKDFLGMDPAVMAEMAGFKVPADTELLFGETKTVESVRRSRTDDAVRVVVLVRVPDVDSAICSGEEVRARASATRASSTRGNVETITRMGREMIRTL